MEPENSWDFEKEKRESASISPLEKLLGFERDSKMASTRLDLLIAETEAKARKTNWGYFDKVLMKHIGATATVNNNCHLKVKSCSR